MYVKSPWSSDPTFQVFTAVLLSIKFTWASRPCALIKRYSHLEGSLWLVLQGVTNQTVINIRWLFFTPHDFTFQQTEIEAIWWINEWLTSCGKVLSETLTVPQLHYKFLYFMQPETSLPPSQKPATLSPTINTKHDKAMLVSHANEQVCRSNVTSSVSSTLDKSSSIQTKQLLMETIQ